MPNFDLIKFLFQDSQEETQLEAVLEECVSVERLEVKKQPLAAALTSLGTRNDVELDTDGYFLVYSDYDEFAADMTALTTPDGINALAELGWIVANSGDVSGPGTMDLPEFKIKFFEVNCPEPSDGAGDEDLEKVQKHLITKGLEGATGELMGESELPDPAVFECEEDDKKEDKKTFADWPDVKGRDAKKVKADTLSKQSKSK